jgi:hypothetical protein
MSRSGYVDDLDPLDLGRWRGQVASAIRGRRGQKLLVDLLKALDAMEVKELITDELVDADGDVCALGCLGKARGLDMKDVDVEDGNEVGELFDIAPQLAREIVYRNDEIHYSSPADRHQKIRQWVANRILPVSEETATA